MALYSFSPTAESNVIYLIFMNTLMLMIVACTVLKHVKVMLNITKGEQQEYD